MSRTASRSRRHSRYEESSARHGVRQVWPPGTDHTRPGTSTWPQPAPRGWDGEYDTGEDEETALWQARRRELAPWAETRPAATLRRARRVRRAPVPVFVDDTGRRRRAGRMIGAAMAVAVLLYLAVIGLSVAGAPYVGHLAPPGLDRLSSPSGDGGVVTGPAVDEIPLPAPPTASESDRGSGVAPTPTESSGDSAAPGTAPTTATTSASTTTTVTHGNSETPTATTPSSTVPTTDPGGGRRPTSPPGQG